MKVALVYDRVNKFGGAERVLLALHELFPDAPLFTAVYNPDTALWAERFHIQPSFLNHFPLAKTHHQLYPWLTPMAFESFELKKFDVVISISSAEAKGVITYPSTLHICYCLTPTRYLWSGYSVYKDKPGFGMLSNIVSKLFILTSPPLRIWDRIAGNTRPDKTVSISQTVAKRVNKYYKIESPVIYPPIDTHRFIPKKKKTKDYFLVVSRLVPYKRIDLIIEAFNDLSWPLLIVGQGSEGQRLKAMAKSTIRFVSDLTEEQLVSYYQGCRALITMGIEDFGLAAIEAQSCGRPVIAYAAGGYVETIIPGKTGQFFYQQTKNALIDCLKNTNSEAFSPTHCRQNALRFSKSRFKKEFLDFVMNQRKTVNQ